MSFICYIYYIIGGLALLSALIVASSLNPIHRIAYLILVFIGAATAMLILDFYFLGLTYIIVYVGAIMILFLFVIMMVQITEVSSNYSLGVTHVISQDVLSHETPIKFNLSPNTMLCTTNLLSSSILCYIGKNEKDELLSISNLTNYLSCVGPHITATTTTTTTTTINSDILSTYSIGMLDEIGNQQDLLVLAGGETTGGHARENGTEVLSKSRSYRSLIGPFMVLILLSYLWIASLYSKINDSFVNYFYPAWSIEFKTMTDLETLANILYVGFPTALILIAIALWVVMIGIIKVTMSDKLD